MGFGDKPRRLGQSITKEIPKSFKYCRVCSGEERQVCVVDAVLTTKFQLQKVLVSEITYAEVLLKNVGTECLYFKADRSIVVVFLYKVYNNRILLLTDFFYFSNSYQLNNKEF